MAEDAELKKAVAAWLAQLQPTAVLPSSVRVLESAERRLIGALKRGEQQSKLTTSVERRAQLGCLKARDRVADLPSDVDD
jgi:hypothetical protein